MARPKTKGDTIGVRFPLAVDEQVRARAQEGDLSPGVWVSRQIERLLAKQRADERIHAQPSRVVPLGAKVEGTVNGHVHEAVIRSGSGIWRCACGAVTTDRGASWRQVAAG